jgi:hypothetical protein
MTELPKSKRELDDYVIKRIIDHHINDIVVQLERIYRHSLPEELSDELYDLIDDSVKEAYKRVLEERNVYLHEKQKKKNETST